MTAFGWSKEQLANNLLGANIVDKIQKSSPSLQEEDWNGGVGSPEDFPLVAQFHLDAIT